MNRFLKSNHLRHAHEFDRIYKLGNKWVSQYWVAYFQQPQQVELDVLSKLGIVASRKVGRATTRNRLKRTAREWFRYENIFKTNSIELILVARKMAGQEPDSSKLVASLNELKKKLGENL